MISLYIHIPFCEKKCPYCSFFVSPINKLGDSQTYMDNYTDYLLQEIQTRYDRLGKVEIKTIYFGGGTPLVLGKNNLVKIMDKILELFDTEFLEEWSIELNPNPYEEVLEFIIFFNKKYKNFFRLRYSFGIQSFDDEVLKNSGRDYYFNYLVMFLRDLYKIKESNNVFNFDFIAFGKFNDIKGKKTLRDNRRIDFLKNFVDSSFVDSFSLYTLELFSPSQWYNEMFKLYPDETEKYIDKGREGLYGDENDIYLEFDILKNIISKGGYKRYEISNFSKGSKNSLHNQVYWNGGNYIGLGMNGSSFLTGNYLKKLENVESLKIDSTCKGIRFTNTIDMKKYIAGEYINPSSIEYLDENQIKIEKFFLLLRQSSGVQNYMDFEEILVDDFESKLEEYISNKFIEINDNNLKLTDKGMNVYNGIIVDLIKKF